MGTATLVSQQEYLGTTYHPDCDYLDGVLEERNVGQKDHSQLQGEIFAWFRGRRRALRVAVFPEQRIRVSHGRYRIPDVCVVQLPVPDEQVFTRPPYICIEVLSPDDRLQSMMERFEDYVAMGVPNIWALDPETRGAWQATGAGLRPVVDGILRTTDLRVELPVEDLFTLD